MTRHEAPSAYDVVTGIISIYGFDAYTLIDPGSTCSFVAYDFALKSHSNIETLGYNICVSMPVGGTIIVDKVVNLSCDNKCECTACGSSCDKT